MRKFRIDDKDTMADIGVEIAADSLEELFIAAGESIFAIILEKAAIFDETRLEVSLHSPDGEQLMVDWLSELLYLFDAEGFIVHTYILEINPDSEGFALHGVLTGRKFRPSMDIVAHEIKAVTYYKLKIHHRGGRFFCHVVFDL